MWNDIIKQDIIIEQYDKIIREIWIQRDNMYCKTNVEPNKVIIGGYIYRVLQRVSGVVCHSQIKDDDGYDAEVLGLKIKVDWQNPYTIEVYYGIDKKDMRSLFE